MDAVHTIALTMGVGWASGINLYAAIVMLGLMQHTGNVALPPDLMVLADPMVMAAAGLMYCVEFFADKTPGLDSGWDAIHSFVRIPAGAMLAAGAVGDVGAAAQLSAGLVGGALATTSHLTKAGSRALINTSPEPFTNWAASIAEDVAVVGGIWAALYHPWVFLALLVGFLALAIWLLPRIWRGLKRVGAALARMLGRAPAPAAVHPAAAGGAPGVPGETGEEPPRPPSPR